jgi:hypothetical protein
MPPICIVAPITSYALRKKNRDLYRFILKKGWWDDRKPAAPLFCALNLILACCCTRSRLL